MPGRMRPRPAPAKPHGGVYQKLAEGEAARRDAQRVLCGSGVFTSREWELAASTLSWWEDKTALAFTHLQCCAFCGNCAFAQEWLPAHDGQPQCRSQGSHLFGTVSPVCAGATPPYAQQCSALRDACVTAGGNWRVCALCKRNPRKRAALQTTVTPTLVRDLLGLKPVEAQVPRGPA